MRVHLTAFNFSSRLPHIIVLVGAVVIVAFIMWSQHDRERAVVDGHGIDPCSSRAEEDVLSPDALQCWFEARQGRWRTLSSMSAHGALVVEADAADPRDAEEIAGRFVAAGRDRFVEILVYVQYKSAPTAPRVRRIRWTRQDGFETLEFTGVSSP